MAALLLSSCNASASAATVNGSVITVSSLNAFLSGASGSSLAACEVSLQLGAQGLIPLQQLRGSGQDTASQNLASTALTYLVDSKIIGQYLKSRGVEITTEDRALARADLASQLDSSAQRLAAASGSSVAGAQQVCGKSGSQILSALPQAFVSAQVRLEAGEEAVAELAGKVHGSYEVVCLNALEAVSQAEANAFHAQLAAGKTFQQLESGGNGGSLGCVAQASIPSSIAPAVNGLAPGAVTAPLEVPGTNGASTAWYILQLSSRSRKSLARMSPTERLGVLSPYFASSSSETHALDAKAHVEIDPAFGHWSPATGVVPPPPPPTSLLPS